MLVAHMQHPTFLQESCSISPSKGTHAHAWVMMFDSEPEAFNAYANAMPNNCVFLVDTYDTLEGVQNAIQAGLALREHGHEKWLE